MERIRLSPETIHASATLARGCDIRSGIIFTEGCTSMRIRCLTQIVSALVLPTVIVGLLPGNASAGGHERPTLQAFDSFAGYAVPIADVYQFPAAIVEQPGAQIPLAPPRPLYIKAGDHHVLPR
jgi:hypothetical protein